MFEGFLRDTRTEILDDKFEVVSRGEVGSGRGSNGFVGKVDVDFAFSIHGLGGIEDEVGNDLADLPWVYLGGPEIFGEEELGSSAGTAKGKGGGIAHELSEVERSFDRGATLGESEELAREAFGLLQSGAGFSDYEGSGRNGRQLKEDYLVGVVYGR